MYKKEELTQKEETIRDILINADMCLIYTGAGMGVDSGLSVFRGTDGLWERYPEAGNLGLDFKSLANPQNYIKYPEVVIPFYLDRYKSYVNADPHSGYYELFGYVSGMKDGYFCVTSNVDGLLEKTGFENVYNMHGSIHKWQCSSYRCAKENDEAGLVSLEGRDLSDIEKLRCPKCKEYLRPNIQMFYDGDCVDTEYDRQENIYLSKTNRYSEKRNKNVAIIEIGAGNEIRSIRSEAENKAYDYDTKVIRINPIAQGTEKEDPYVIMVEMSAAAGVAYIMSLIEKK